MDLQQQGQGTSRQAGFVPPVVDPHMIKQEQDDYYSEDSCDRDWTPPSKRIRIDGTLDEGSNSPAATPRPGPRRHTGPRAPRKHEVVSSNLSLIIPCSGIIRVAGVGNVLPHMNYDL